MVVNGDEGGASIVCAKYDRSSRFQLGGKPVTDLVPGLPVFEPSSNKVRRSKVKSMLFQRFLCTLVATHHPASRCTLPHATTPRATNRSCSNRSKMMGEEGDEEEYDSWSVHSSLCLDDTNSCTVVRFSNGEDGEGGRLSFLLSANKRSSRGRGEGGERGNRSRETDENCRNELLRELSLAHAQNRTNSRLSLEYHGRSKLDLETISLLDLDRSSRGFEFTESSLISRSNSWENSEGRREEESGTPDRGRRRIIRTYASRHRCDHHHQVAEVNQVNSFASALSLSSFARNMITNSCKFCPR